MLQSVWDSQPVTGFQSGGGWIHIEFCFTGEQRQPDRRRKILVVTYLFQDLGENLKIILNDVHF